jgi:hypothetical protein
MKHPGLTIVCGAFVLKDVVVMIVGFLCAVSIHNVLLVNAMPQTMSLFKTLPFVVLV